MSSSPPLALYEGIRPGSRRDPTGTPPLAPRGGMGGGSRLHYQVRVPSSDHNDHNDENDENDDLLCYPNGSES